MAEYSKVGLNTGDTLEEADSDVYETQYDCAKYEFEQGTWKLKKNIEPDSDNARDVGTASARIRALYAMAVRESRAHFRDDFFGAALLDWWNFAGTGTYNSFVQDYEGGGWWTFGATSGSGNNCTLGWNGNRTLKHSKNLEISFRIRLDQTTQQTIRVGLYKDSTHYIWFEVDPTSSAVNWYAKSHDGSTPNSSDTSTLSDTSIHILTIRCASGHIYFDIDGVNKVDMTSNIPSDYFQPHLYVTTKESADKYVRLDYVEAFQDR